MAFVLDRVLFAEGGARILVSVRAECLDSWMSLLASDAHVAVPVTTLGAGGGSRTFRLHLGSNPVLDLRCSTLTECFKDALPRRLGTA